MALVERARKILFTPAEEWAVIAAEHADTTSLFRSYAAPLAAIGPLAAWIGHSLIGVTVPPFGTVRTPLLSGLVLAVVAYGVTLAGVFVIGLVIDALARSFGGERNATLAMRCSVYAYTPAWVAGIFELIPALDTLVVVASLYGVYLCYLGLRVLMKAPKDEAIGYTAVVAICAVVLAVVLGVVGGLAGYATGALRG